MADSQLYNDSESRKQDIITLKWGNLKSWNIETEAALKVLNRMEYLPAGAAGHYSMEQALWLIDLIDASNCETVHLDWDGVDVSKSDAIAYVKKSNSAFQKVLLKGGSND